MKIFKIKITAHKGDSHVRARGFAMLFSVLISSLLVVIGLSIFNITLKELTISTAGRESQKAFYAANSGMECALYWDLKWNAFATSSDSDEISRVAGIDAKCNGTRINDNHSTTGGVTETVGSFNVASDTGGPCADISVSISSSGAVMTTVIKSRGKNICGASGRKVERGLQATITRDI